MRIPPRAGPLLVLDSGSPLVSVALGGEGGLLAARAEEISRSSTRLLEMVDEVLAAAGMELAEVGGVAALAGPGSFTGLRIGLATVLGFRQALGLPATAVPTLRVLASLAPPRTGRTFGAVDSLRGEWAVEEWRAGEPVDGMRLLAAADLARLAPCALVGFGVSKLRALPGWPADAEAIEPGPLAPAALALLIADEAADSPDSWDTALLTAPIYARPPAVSQPRERHGRRGAPGAAAGRPPMT